MDTKGTNSRFSTQLLLSLLTLLSLGTRFFKCVYMYGYKGIYLSL